MVETPGLFLVRRDGGHQPGHAGPLAEMALEARMAEPEILEGTILVAGDVELHEGKGREPEIAERSVVIQFDSVDDLRRFIKESLPVKASWYWEKT